MIEAGGALDDALGICNKSPLYLQAVDELGIYDFEFNCSTDTVEYTSIQGHLLGAVLRPTKVRDPRMGATISLTFDLQEHELNVLEFVVIWCLIDIVIAISISFDRWKPLYAELRSQRVEYLEPPRMIRPRIENQWAFVRENPPPLLIEDIVLEGWPAIVPERKYWLFNGSSHAEWANREEITYYRCAQVSERLSTGLDQLSAEQYRFLDLTISQ